MNFRKLTSLDLAKEFIRVRKRTISTFEQFKKHLGSDLEVKIIPTINTPRWEFGHVAWFSERWILRNKERNEGEYANYNKILSPDKNIKPYFKDADKLFDSSTLAHNDRWQVKLPNELEIKRYLNETLSSIIVQIEKEQPSTNQECYFYRLSLAHEYMHLEAFVMTARSLNFPIFNFHKKLIYSNFTRSKMIKVSEQKLFSENSKSEFVFDNETLDHHVNTKSYEIDTSPVSVKDFMQFYEKNCYSNQLLWSKEGWNWLSQNQDNTFINFFSTSANREYVLNKWFGLDHLVNTDFPALHISYYEAEAYCNWKKRRLPTELEWMLATQKNEFKWGYVWEWTKEVFVSYKKFRPHPYEEYSKPWFDNHQVVKGSSFATQERFKSIKFRNFYQKHRNDVFIGFRTVKDLL